MLMYLGRRFLWAVFVLWLVVTAVFLLMNAVGDPAVAALGPRAHASQLEAFRREHGLDRPLTQRYVTYLAGLVTGDWGRSFKDQQPVIEVMATRVPRTLLLSALAMLFELGLGVTLGTIAALRKHTLFDTGLMGMAFLGISLPTFLTGIVFLYAFGYRLAWFPVGGYGTGTWDHLYHALLPAFTLAIVGAATYARIMRSEMLEVLNQDYIRTARAKGLSPIRVIGVHAMRNALLPIVTLIGLSLPFLVSGAVITETIFGWPGMGRLAIEALYTLDVPIVMGVVLVASLAVQIGNLLADVAVALLDPRIRLGSQASA